MATPFAACTKEEQHAMILHLWAKSVPGTEDFLHIMGTVLYRIEVCMNGLARSKTGAQT
jgi:hypothetical protein